MANLIANGNLLIAKTLFDGSMKTFYQHYI